MDDERLTLPFHNGHEQHATTTTLALNLYHRSLPSTIERFNHRRICVI
jgi:hypothetical protein